MKILQIIYSLSSGGAERFIVDLSNELAEQGHDVILCILRDDKVENNGFYKHEISNNVMYKNLKITPGFSFDYTIRINKLINISKPDIIHCHQNLINYVFPLSLIHRKIKFFYTVHNDAITELKNKFELYLRKFFFKNRINVITISYETSKSYRECYKLDNHIEIYNGRKSPEASKEIERTNQFYNNLRRQYDFIFLHIARCSPEKNQKMLINVINRLTNEGKNIALLIVGSGFESNLGKQLKEMAGSNLYFLGQRHNIVDHYLNADAFCLSSLHEGMPITLIESLSCGCIPICTPVGGIINTIKNGYNGFLSKSTTEEDYYQAIINFITNKNQIKKESLLKYYQTIFSIEKCAFKHIQAYNSH